MSDALSLASLFASSFLSATLLPGNSEVVLVAMLLSGVSQPWLLVLIATMGNSLGGLTNVILGRFFPLREKSRWQEKAVGWLKRYGAATLLLSWMPVIGDLLCLLAGWMRISWGPVLFFLCLGQGVALCSRGVGNTTGYDVVALIGGMNTRPSIVNHYNYAE
ncbi:putative inner membrane protein [Enterobacter asburiae]|uniref:Putative inner membrane protein n=3 Tax=Enterobacteriaceae TaxID=543 RepID=A0A376FDQ3_ENTAS|nr:putative inner membrane protein [Enterobacter asburiae]